MSHTALLTQTTQQVAELNTEGYLSGVAGHTGGDWAAHTSVQIHEVPFLDENDQTVTGSTLRLKVTYDNGGSATDVLLAVPVTASLSAPGGVGAAPFIAVQPRNTTVVQGSMAVLSVVAVSVTEATTFQWQKDDQGTWMDLSQGTYSTLIFAAAQTSDGATYRCQVSNTYGTTTTSEVTLTVSIS